MILYDDGEVGKAIEPHFVETHVGDGLHIYEDRTQVGDIVFITADKFKKYISIEWLKRYEIIKGQEVRLQDAINEWEKENEHKESD